MGRTPKGAYSSRGRSRHLLQTAFSEPLLRTLKPIEKGPLLRTLLRTPSPEPFPEPSQNPFLERCLAVRPLRRAPKFCPQGHPGDSRENRYKWTKTGPGDLEGNRNPNTGSHLKQLETTIFQACARRGVMQQHATLRRVLRRLFTRNASEKCFLEGACKRVCISVGAKGFAFQ